MLQKNNFSDSDIIDIMGILDNFENALNDDFEFESNPIVETDAMGREVFWQDMGRPEEPNLAVKLFSETCCNNCSCGN
jgi:hypothetical protein